MFLSKLFKHTRAKVLTALAGLTMVLGVGATITTVSATQNEVAETKADNTHTVYFIDEAWWQTDVVGVYLYAWDSTTVESASGVVHNAAWPGVLMTPPQSVSSTGGNHYYAMVDTDLYDRMLVCRTNANGVDAQTIDLTISNSSLNSNDTYSIAGTSPAWTGQGNKVTGAWTDSTKSNWYIVGDGSFVTGTAWTTAGGVRMKLNPNNTEDKGMALHQHFNKGDVFKIWDNSTWLSYDSFEDTSLKYPCFEGYAQGNAQYTLEENGSWSTGTWSSGPASSNYSAVTLYLWGAASWTGNQDCKLAIETNTGAQIVSSGSSNPYTVTFNPSEYSWFKVGRKNSDGFYNVSGQYNSSSLISSGTNIYVAKTGYYDIYVTKDQKLFIKNSIDESKGFLYISMLNNGGTSFIANSGKPYVHAWYKNASNTVFKITGNHGTRTFEDSYYGYTESLTFNSKGGLYRLPLSIFNGASQFTLYSYGGGAEKWKSGDSTVPIASAPLYCLVAANTAITTDGTKGKAAEAAFEIERAIAGTNKQTLCALTQAQATTLVNLYDVATAASASGLHTTASVNTYIPNGNHYNATTGVITNTSKESVAMTRIYAELVSRSTTGKWRIQVIPGAPKGNESPLTLTLWIVLGCGVAGLGAIGTAYFVSKKKGRHQA